MQMLQYLDSSLQHCMFTFCLVLFLVLLLFNSLLLLTRILSRVKFINTFKPLFDAYFGPYKDKFYFWTGLQLLMRAVIFVLSGFDRDINLTGGIFVIGIALCSQGILHPFKSKLKNAQELLLLLNLLMIYVIALQNDDNNKTKVFLSSMLILIALMYLVIYITCHCIMLLCSYSNSIKQKMDYLSKKFAKVMDEPVAMPVFISELLGGEISPPKFSDSPPKMLRHVVNYTLNTNISPSKFACSLPM